MGNTTQAATSIDRAPTVRQEQQLDRLRERAFEQADVLSTAPQKVTDKPQFPNESPCFVIRSVELRNASEFPWLAVDAAVIGACIGSQGLKLYRQWVARQLLERGFVTSQVSVPAQDLTQGRLVIDILPGRIGTIRDDNASLATPHSVFPGGSGELLNVRALDQALENIRRLPGQARTAFTLVPGMHLGDSDIVIQRTQAPRRAVGVLTADNTGTTATGRHQLGAAVVLNSPLGLYDQLLLTYNTDAEFNDHTLGSSSKSLAWNLPVGYASVSLGASEWTNKQELLRDAAGNSVPLSGKTRRFDVGLSYVVYRSSHSKGSVHARLVRREDRSWVSSTELQQWHRDITSYELGVAHREKLANSTLDLALGVRGGLPGLSRSPGAVYEKQDWHGRYEIFTARAAIETLFSLRGRAWHYLGSVLLQHAPDPVPSTEYVQIGGRYTVRGFDGDTTLNGPDGWLWRNEIATAVFSGSEAYTALDAGQVFSVGNRPTHSDALIGTSLGIRGQGQALGYDFSLGLPINKPGDLHSREPSVDFLLSRRF
ncbi:ShlB/FhaC/HecB family hemolysin secretion/activation protein [Pseudomonas sp. GZD-222]|uniref:ShlB/FhaC/HecB family hemolysin secretion/activation protein n=1 Tax=Pseudomonas sp. GZD-222 TaxID=3404805 RepID=UPI003BB63F07